MNLDFFNPKILKCTIQQEWKEYVVSKTGLSITSIDINVHSIACHITDEIFFQFYVDLNDLRLRHDNITKNITVTDFYVCLKHSGYPILNDVKITLRQAIKRVGNYLEAATMINKALLSMTKEKE